MKHWKEGDLVRVVTREQTAQDVKEQTYFPHFAGLEGTVVKVYSPEEICVEINRDSLPEANAARQNEIEKFLRNRWLDGLSQDARSRLSEAEHRFHLNYTLLVKGTDLESAKGGKPRSTGEKEARLKPKDLDKAEEEFLKAREH